MQISTTARLSASNPHLMLPGASCGMGIGGAVAAVRRWRSRGGSGRGLSMLARVMLSRGGAGRGLSMDARSSAAGGCCRLHEDKGDGAAVTAGGCAAGLPSDSCRAGKCRRQLSAGESGDDAHSYQIAPRRVTLN